MRKWKQNRVEQVLVSNSGLGSVRGFGSEIILGRSLPRKSENWEKSSREYCMFMIKNEKEKKNIHNKLEKLEFDNSLENINNIDTIK